MTEENGTVPAAVVTVEKVLVVGKESSEVADSLSELIKDIKAGKDVSLIAAENLPGLVKAVDGYDKMDDEMKHSSRNATVAYSGYVVAEALAPVK